MKTMLMICALLLLAGSALAVPLNPDGSAIWFANADSFVMRCADGRTHQYNAASASWTLDVVPPIPLPDEEIADWFGRNFVRTDGKIWSHDNAAAVGWHELADYPCGAPVSNQERSLGDVKSMYR
jgi:hypothetical protein